MLRSAFVLLSALALAAAGPQIKLVDDLLEHKPVNHTWMEIGYVNLTDQGWTRITTTVTNLNPNNDRDISVYLSLPEYGGATAEEGWSMVTKMNGRATRTASGAYTFEARLVQPNDSYCPHVYWTPKPSPTINVGWLIVEEGVYNVTSSMLVFGSGEITRDNTVPQLKDDRPAFWHAVTTFNYTTGCDAEDPDAVCTYVEKVSDFDFVTSPYNGAEFKYSDTGWSHLGSTNQLQTSINKGPDGPDQELWINTRIKTVFTDRISIMLAVHSVLVTDENENAMKGPYNYNFTVYPDYADIHTPEIVAYFVWEKEMRLECIEGLVMETSIQFPITHTAMRMDYYYQYAEVPGLFGMIGTLNSVGDTTSLRTFNRTKTGSNFITQEDQCVDEEVLHQTGEAAFSMVVGTTGGVGDTACFIAYNVQGCTYTIYLYDLFGDGWDNVHLVLEVDGMITNHTTSCGPKAITFSSQHCDWNAHMATSDGKKPVTWWENYWRYEHEDSRDDRTVYIGDYDSTISVKHDVVEFTDLVNFRVDAKENKCEQCKVAPPPPKKGAANGKGKGDADNSANGGVADLTAGNIAPTPPEGVAVAPNDPGAPEGVLQITGVSERSAGDPATFTVYYALNVVDLTSAVDSAAFYRGAEGMTGPSIHSIDVTGFTTTFYVEGSFVVTEEDIVNWIMGKIYIQVNTANWLSGEIRAQAVLPSEWVQYYLSLLDDDSLATLVGDGYGKTGGKKADDDDSAAYGTARGHTKPNPNGVVLIELFDEAGNGWYNHSGTWSYPVKVVDEQMVKKGSDDDDKAKKAKIEPAARPIYELDSSIAVFPDILMYPTYVIMTVDKTKQLHVGSLCPHREIERCEERLPPHGEFVFRVMGKDPEGDDSWKFCGVEGFIGQELQFEMKKGVCVPTALINSFTLCSLNTRLTVAGELVLGGVSTDLSEVDSKVLENEIALMLVSTTSVSITSWKSDADGNTHVSFEASLVAERQGVDGRYRENLETLVSKLQSNMETAFSSGAFLSQVEMALLEYPQSQVGITRTTFVSLNSLEITNVEYVEASTVINARNPSALPEAQAVASAEEQKVDESPSVIFSACVVVGVVVIVAALAIRTRKPTEHVHQQLAMDSEHADSIPEFDLGLEHVESKKGMFFVSKERF